MSLIHTANADAMNQTPVGAANPLPIAGPNAVDAAAVMAPLIGGSVARNVAQTSMTATGDTVNDFADMSGRKIVKLMGVPPSHDFNRVTLTATTETTLIASVAANKHELQSITIANRDTAQATVDFRDTTAGTVRLSVVVPTGDTRQLTFPAGMTQAAFSTNWTAQLRAATTTNGVEISTSSYRTTA